MFTFTDIEAGKNDQPKFTLKSSDGSHSCDIYLYGCTVTSWIHNGIEKLFCSPTTPFNGVNAIRGGIPVVFPQFGRPDEVMPQHGFARTSTWSLERSECTDTAGTAVFTLSDNESTRAVWPHSFTLLYTVSLSASGLRTTFEATNHGSASFDCQALLHTYIAVPKIEDVRVKGLGGLALIDKMAPAAGSDLPVDDREFAVIDREVDRIYVDAGHVMHTEGDVFSLPAVVVLHESETLMQVQRKAYVKLADEIETKVVRSLPTDCVLWNAWIEKTRSIGDLENDAYLRYVCVEPGICSRYETVEPKHTMVLDQYLCV
mmetsp:Transcript_1275/g.2657  ORF Transcript_1275/g.2657 Transcript_1275/m.2657 type:complete len:316 (-) Transcript_1275:224-1171(-)|eukprot:CAMPEP_0170378744 /NCGR_PEP_ID=MMETSP0117_2-20130122/12970_1 /TAXON_ID=400756 /ORGANISM="Durinskia baltica, Strain CSIRO CS-38" /LENGTH=315 /DNA_ID=CAMNT_0010634131 /DNA_START=50 /DNA_END=997 /DNA_ORIENTATION=+